MAAGEFEDPAAIAPLGVAQDEGHGQIGGMALRSRRIGEIDQMPSAWRRMREAAVRDGIVLEAISGYRSHDYQLGIFERKLARAQTVAQILRVNAAPGFSEHHSGLALDIGTPGEPPAEESFEATPAFAWLQAHAGAHGYAMSYPRENPHGIVYEPWHWRFAG